MNRLCLAVCAMLVLVPFSAFAQNDGDAAPAPFWGFRDTYQVTYFPNTITNDGVLNLVNTGAYTQPTTAINTGYLCANIYVFGAHTGIPQQFDPSGEEMAACCTCPISRNGSRSIRAQQLLSNPLKIGAYPSVTVKVVWTRPANDNPNNCAATALPAANTRVSVPAAVGPVDAGAGFATGGRCWSTGWHAPLPAPPNGTVTPPFGTGQQCVYAPLSANESNMLSNLCSIIWFSLGSGQGRCPVCPTGGTQGAQRL